MAALSVATGEGSVEGTGEGPGGVRLVVRQVVDAGSGRTSGACLDSPDLTAVLVDASGQAVGKTRTPPGADLDPVGQHPTDDVQPSPPQELDWPGVSGVV